MDTTRTRIETDRGKILSKQPGQDSHQPRPGKRTSASSTLKLAMGVAMPPFLARAPTSQGSGPSSPGISWSPPASLAPSSPPPQLDSHPDSWASRRSQWPRPGTQLNRLMVEPPVRAKLSILESMWPHDWPLCQDERGPGTLKSAGKGILRRYGPASEVVRA